MSDLATAYVQIVPSAKGIKGKLSQALGGEAASAGDSSGASFGGAMVSKIKGLVAAAGIGTVVKEALEAGGDLQQSFGGLDTIYGEASDAAKKYANEAVKAGISANDYAEQAVAFGASLKQAFAGDTTQAVEAANTAIMDMADNAAKMGTPLESIQNAYQGFAKQNYTMLDNLKLGYGGTKEEMQRLLEDAQALSGVEYDISNLGDVYSAIHVIQEDLGLTGVAADEAAGTFTGSMAAMKASATNLLAALTTGGDVAGAFESLAGNARVFIADNLLPMIGNLLEQLPEILKGAMQQGLVAIQELTSNSAEIINSAISIITQLGETLIEHLPDILDAGTELLMSIVDGIGENLPKLVETAIKIIIALVEGLGKAIPKLIEKVPDIIAAIWDTIISTDWLSLGKNILLGIRDGLVAAGSALWDALKRICSDVLKNVKSFFGIHSPSRVMADQVGKFLPAGIAEGIEGNISSVTNAMSDLADEATGSVNASFRANIAGSNYRAAGSAIADNNNSGMAASIASAVANSLLGMGIYMDSQQVGALVAQPVNNALGRIATRGIAR